MANKIEFVIGLDNAQYKKAANEVIQQTEKIGKTGGVLQGVFQGIGQAVGQFALQAIGQIGAFLKDATQKAIDFQEANAKFGTVFKGVEAEAEALRTQLVNAFGVSRLEATKYLSSIQDLLVPMGMARKDAALLSGEIVKLASDLGSFNNQPTSQVMMDIQSALVGNYETMKKYGVILNETTLKTAGVTKETTQAEKAQKIYELIVKSSGDALGDFSRTSSSTANQIKILNSTIENISQGIGDNLLNALQPVLTVLNDLLSGFDTLENQTRRLAEVTEQYNLVTQQLADSKGKLNAEQENELLERQIRLYEQMQTKLGQVAEKSAEYFEHGRGYAGSTPFQDDIRNLDNLQSKLKAVKNLISIGGQTKEGKIRLEMDEKRLEVQIFKMKSKINKEFDNINKSASIYAKMISNNIANGIPDDTLINMKAGKLKTAIVTQLAVLEEESAKSASIIYQNLLNVVDAQGAIINASVAKTAAEFKKIVDDLEAKKKKNEEVTKNAPKTELKGLVESLKLQVEYGKITQKQALDALKNSEAYKKTVNEANGLSIDAKKGMSEWAFETLQNAQAMEEYRKDLEESLNPQVDSLELAKAQEKQWIATRNNQKEGSEEYKRSTENIRQALENQVILLKDNLRTEKDVVKQANIREEIASAEGRMLDLNGKKEKYNLDIIKQTQNQLEAKIISEKDAMAIIQKQIDLEKDRFSTLTEGTQAYNESLEKINNAQAAYDAILASTIETENEKAEGNAKTLDYVEKLREKLDSTVSTLQNMAGALGIEFSDIGTRIADVASGAVQVRDNIEKMLLLFETMGKQKVNLLSPENFASLANVAALALNMILTGITAIADGIRDANITNDANYQSLVNQEKAAKALTDQIDNYAKSLEVVQDAIDYLNSITSAAGVDNMNYELELMESNLAKLKSSLLAGATAFKALGGSADFFDAAGNIKTDKLVEFTEELNKMNEAQTKLKSDVDSAKQALEDQNFVFGLGTNIDTGIIALAKKYKNILSEQTYKDVTTGFLTEDDYNNLIKELERYWNANQLNLDIANELLDTNTQFMKTQEDITKIKEDIANYDANTSQAKKTSDKEELERQLQLAERQETLSMTDEERAKWQQRQVDIYNTLIDLENDEVKKLDLKIARNKVLENLNKSQTAELQKQSDLQNEGLQNLQKQIELGLIDVENIQQAKNLINSIGNLGFDAMETALQAGNLGVTGENISRNLNLNIVQNIADSNTDNITNALVNSVVSNIL